MNRINNIFNTIKFNYDLIAVLRPVISPVDQAPRSHFAGREELTLIRTPST
jgi:hypothetical protein